MSDILEELNDKQREAVITMTGPVQIIAGAGSGKTKTFTHRIAYLIEQGVKPWNILALTFTNRAAREIKDRIASLLKDTDSSNNIWAGTFHSIFARILRIEGAALGYDSNYTIYDSNAAESAMKKVMEDNKILPADIRPRSILSVISLQKNKYVMPAEYSNGAYSRFEQNVAEIYPKYQEYLLKNNAMDFDDILINMLRLLENSDILAKYQDKFHYILIDEHQDTNKVQYLAVKELAKHRQNICVVGDDAQSIYKWRGADIGNILNFDKDYPNCKVIKLEQNYRSTKKILAAADSVILNNKNQLRKVLWTDNAEGEKIKIYKFENEKDEAAQIIRQISNKIKNGEDIKEFVVLYRTNAQSLEFEKACRMYELPYIIIGGFSFFKRAEINDVLSYLRLLINPKDEMSLRRIINEPPRGIGNKSVSKLEEFANYNNITMFEGLGVIDENALLSGIKKTLNSMRKLSFLFAKHTQLLNEGSSPEHLVDYINETGILDWYKELDTEEAKDKIRNIEELLNDIVNYLNADNENTLNSYLEQVSLINDLDDKNFGDNVLRLMTIHSSKALEFDNVYIAGLETGLFPLSVTAEDIEEERRLCYVAMTRARKHLAMSYTALRYKYGRAFTNPPSIFLEEISPELLEDVYNNTFLKSKVAYSDIVNTIPHQSFNKFEKKEYNPKPKFPSGVNRPAFDDMQYEENYSQIPKPQYSQLNNARLRTGNVVKHNQFGTGIVTNISGVGDNQKVVVNFDKVGRKQLLLKFANLEMMN